MQNEWNELLNKFSCLPYGAKEEGEKIDFTLEDVGNWLDEAFDKFPEFIQVLSSSMDKMGGFEKNVSGPKAGQ